MLQEQTSDPALPASGPLHAKTLASLYQDRFDPDDYIATYYSRLDVEVEFFLRNLHDFFACHGTLTRSVTQRSKVDTDQCSKLRDRDCRIDVIAYFQINKPN